MFINNAYRFGTNPLLVGLVHFAPLDVNSNGQISGINGTDTGISYPTTGTFEKSADFTAGTTSQIDFGDSDIFSFGDGTDDSDFTIDVSFAHAVLPNADFIFGKRDASTNREYQFGYVTGGTKLRFRAFDQSTGGTRSIDYVLNPVIDTFYRITITCVSGVLKIYSEGVDTGETHVDGGSYTAMENGTAGLILGKYSASTSFSLNGYIKNLRIWNRGLSDAEVLNIPTLNT